MPSIFVSTPIKGKYILVTGGAGFIGSHTILQLCRNRHDVVVVDNLCNSCEDSVKRVEIITGRKIPFYLCDVRDKENLTKIFDKYDFWAVIHFAGLKSVAESFEIPDEYIQNNVEATRILVECMMEHNVHNIVFSSSATLYGYGKNEGLLTEDCNIDPINPYGKSKQMAENVITEKMKIFEDGQACFLRYFNPIGADATGLIGENPKDIPNNLIPYITQTLVGKREFLNVFGNDYNTPDGTCIRDYIHVIDLADGHLAALEKLRINELNRKNSKVSVNDRIFIYNMGNGIGYSVLEIIEAMNKTAGKQVPYKIAERRKGDADRLVTSSAKANKELGWFTQYNLEQMCADAWRWQSTNPDGYDNPSQYILNLLDQYKK
ncbi:UDP-glucose 4-epimerase [Neocallimastix lanati (nom. inval.)]|nr:UDP-glucose 4-epimerase [Neocallimastix sp. JGI-2020a]